MNGYQTMFGSFFRIYDADGNWLTNGTNIEANGEVSKEEIPISGSRTVQHKVTGITYSGTFTGYKMNTAFAKKLAQVANDKNKSFVTQLVVKLDDPDNDSKVWVRLKGVQFDVIPIISAELGNVVTEETPFTFSGFEYL